MTSTHPLRIAVAGLGRMGRIHAANLARRTVAAELAAVLDADETLARNGGRELGVRWSTTFEHLLDDPQVDAIVVATPPGLHVEMIELAAAAAKHVLCEKPLSYDLAGGRRAVEAAATAGIKLQMGFQMRFHPAFTAAAARIASGEVGSPYLFRASLRDQRPPHAEYLVNSGGYLFDAAIHDFDLARWLVGEIVEVTSFGAALSDPRFEEMGDVDNVVVVARFQNGCLGVIDNSRVAGYGFECSAEIMGERATARMGGHRDGDVVWLTPGVETRGRISSFVECFAPAYVAEIEHFARAVLDRRPVRVSAVDGLAATALCLAATDSLRTGRSMAVARIDSENGLPAEQVAVGDES